MAHSHDKIYGGSCPPRRTPVSYLERCQATVQSMAASDEMQQEEDALVSGAHSATRRHSNEDSHHSSNSGSEHRLRRPVSAHETSKNSSSIPGSSSADAATDQRQTLWPDFDTDSDNQEPSSSSTMSAFPAPPDVIPKKPLPSNHSARVGRAAKRRGSTKSNSSAHDPSPIGTASSAHKSSHCLVSTAKSKRDSTNRLGTGDSDRSHAGHGWSIGSADQSLDSLPASTYKPSASKQPENLRNSQLGKNSYEDIMTAAEKARAFRASRTFTLQPLPDQDQFTPNHHDLSSVPIQLDDNNNSNNNNNNTAKQIPTVRRGQMRLAPEGGNPPLGRPGGPPLSLLHEVAFVFIIAAAQALMLSGISQALIPATIIGESIGRSRPVDLAWFSAAYALTAGTFVLPAGRLGDLFGHKKIFIIGFFWFAVWSFLAGWALLVHNVGANGYVYFNICRAVQGIGPALQVPNGQAMLGRAYSPGRRKALVMSLFGAAAPFGFVAGGAMASLFAQVMTWAWAFWVLAAVCVAFGSLSILILPNSLVEKRNKAERLWVQVDAPGIVLGVSGLVLFNFSWNQAAQVTWATPYTYFLLIISILLVSAFVYVELHAKHPLVPVSAMKVQTNFILACTAAGWGCFSVWVFYSFQFLEVLRGWSPLLSAASHGPGPVTGLLASLLVARFMMKVGPHWIMLISMAAFLSGSILMATAPIEQTYWANTFVSVLVMPFGMDMSTPAATIIFSNSVGKEHQGIAASLVVTVVNYSIGTALGFAATIETQVNNGGQDILAGFRGAQYFGVGLGTLGCAIALAFALTNMRRQKAASRAVHARKQAEAPAPSSASDTEPLSSNELKPV